MKPRHQRIALILGGVAAVGVAAFFVLRALNSNIALYVTPTDVLAGKSPADQAFRMGGMVKDGSVKREGMATRFILTDTAKDVSVAYVGILPDLFREGKGAVVQGRLEKNGEFIASEVLAKHDENYMPPEAKHAIEQAQGKQAGKPQGVK